MDRATRNLLIAVQLCFGVFPLLGIVAMEAFAPRAVLVWRLLVGAAVLMPFALRRHRERALPRPRDLAALAGLSMLGITINQLLFLEGLSRSTATNAGLIMTVIPVATLALAALFGQERLTARGGAGIALSVAGVAVLFAARGASVGADTTTGDLLMTANCVSYSLYLVLSKPVLRRVPNSVALAWMFLFAAISVPWFCLELPWAPALAGPTQWWALVGVLVFPTVLAYLGNIIVLSRTHASITAAYVMMQPVVAALLGITVLGERPEPILGLTAVLVLGGLWLASSPRRGAQPAA